MAIQHVSVDFWHTLGEPNPEYGAARNQILARHYLCPPEQAGQMYKRLKNVWEQQAVESGVVPDVEALRQQMNVRFDYKLSLRQFGVMLEELEREFCALPPAICGDSLDTMYQLNARGVTVSVGSNTNFIIRGAVLQTLLPPNLFSFQLYSDAVGFCKPSPVFFSSVLLLAGRANPDLTRPQQILHVGDSVACDCVGASQVGMDTYLCSADNPLRNILKTVENENADC